MIRVGSLFSGIGGIDLGLERAGMRVIWQCENDPYASRVLARHWPDVPNLGDVRAVDWGQVERPDLICGGYPCQPFSLAGLRQGTDDPRHLWPYFARALRVLRPRFALLENVPGHISAGFGDVLADLAALRYGVEWECLPAAAFGAPHLRWRLFVVAHAGGPGRPKIAGGAFGDESPNAGRAALSDNESHRDGQGDRTRNLADANRGRREGIGLAQSAGVECAPRRLADGRGHRGEFDDAAAMALADGGGRARRTDEPGRPAGPYLEPERAGLGRWGWWESEPDVGRVAHGIPARVDRLRALGNAVVPQMAEWVGRRIVEASA